ncbi:ABC transporter ATP-binding protein [Aurantimonas sp. HBX-1]|uniref:ABC transporter ATP-binding protein n=1 Tax=Aurantimonas sp. HBX-1 TaxID=2906072 RepID=UPI001F1A3DB8|nr:ABC transporter ATP-binding protein [Aurantimonas sp. HBX-1]UIJ72136.1 ABC transporter ATP-binding protein [Aurantimonas sp. HBX-1]
MTTNHPEARVSPADSGFALTDVRYDIAGTTILHPLSARIAGGQVLGLVGPNGSGKSTLLRLLARQAAPSAGKLTFDGRPLANWPAREFARRIAYLPQYPQAGTGLTSREVVALGRYPWHGPFGRFTKADAAATEEAMALTGTSAFADRDLDTLSGGERQRVWLAMLVAQDAGCLLLDEPTSALDVSHQIEVLSLIRRLAHEGGRCVVVVLHDVNMASRFCDHVLALRDGRLVASETVHRFMTPECLHRVYRLDMQILAHPRHPAGVAVAN